MKGSKILATIVAIAMIVSAIAIINVGDNTVQATRNITTVGNKNVVVLSNDGSGAAHNLLTCGEYITLYVNNNSLIPDEDYAVKAWNGSAWVALYDLGSTDDADGYGDIAIQFRVPGWDELGQNPMIGDTGGGLSAGQWKISLFTESGSTGTQVWTGLNITINIGNLYYAWITPNNTTTEKTYLTYGEEERINVHVKNWTGSTGWEETYSDAKGIGAWVLTISANGKRVDGADAVTVNADKKYAYIDLDAYGLNYEDLIWMNISSSTHSDFYSNISIPVKLKVQATMPQNKVWGDDFTISGYVLNANSSAITGYNVALYAPVASGNNGAWALVNSQAYETSGDGFFEFDVDTGPDDVWSAGTWYFGTLESAGSIDVSDEPPYITNFIPYYDFVVGTNEDDLVIRVENSADIISGFVQTINVSVDNDTFAYSGTSDGTKEFQNMKLHVTGLAGWDGTTEYDDDDIVPVTLWQQYNSADEKETYYLFNYTFNETGTATVIASWPGNQTSHTRTSPKVPGDDSYYSNTYNEATEMLANITGSKTFTVVSPDAMNLIINNMVDTVSITKSGTGNNYWKNASSRFLLQVFGDSQSEPMNATLKVSGCGLDFTIKESAPANTDECLGYPGDGTYTGGQYYVQISPKTSGTLTITATNGSDSVSKDYAVTGLTGSVTTSDGDDLKITVGQTETITVQASSNYAEVHLSYYDSDWAQISVLNDTTGDETSGNGLGGTYLFNPDADDITKVGYIVVAAQAGTASYMYDIIEVDPIYDLDIVLLEPINESQLFTVGIPLDLKFKLVEEGTETVVEDDDPSVTVKLIDEDHDEDNPLQSWSSADGDISYSDPEWEFDNMVCGWLGQLVITGENNSDGKTHSGNLTVDVALPTIQYSPEYAVAGIGTEDLTVTVTGLDANGDPLPEGTDLYFWCLDAVDDDVNGDFTPPSTAVDFKNADITISLDENGEGEFELDKVGDNKTKINATLRAYNPALGNRTLGSFEINFPVFDISPETIYIGQSNIVTIYAYEDEAKTIPIVGVNLTLFGAIDVQPDPVETNADGKVVFSLQPESSGILNLTIARNVSWVAGALQWENAVITDSYITIDALSTFTISVSKSPIYQGETLTVTVKSGTSPVEGVDVSFGELTGKTGTDGTFDFSVPDPGVESAIYTITAEKNGYITKEKSITVIKVYTLSGTATYDSNTGMVTVNAIMVGKGPAVGATITFNDETATTDAYGQATFTAPTVDKDTEYTATITYDGKTATATVKITPTPGFELLTLIAAIGIAFILLRRRRNK